MQPVPCSHANSLLDTDFKIAAQQETVQKIKVMETVEGFYLLVEFKWAMGKEWYLTTRRVRTHPKIYKDLNRLNEYLKETFPHISFELIRNQKIPRHQVMNDAPKGHEKKSVTQPKRATRKKLVKSKRVS